MTAIIITLASIAITVSYSMFLLDWFEHKAELKRKRAHYAKYGKRLK